MKTYIFWEWMKMKNRYYGIRENERNKNRGIKWQ